MTTYIVTAAPGYHGDTLVVYNSHRSLGGAMKARRGSISVAVYETSGARKKGDKLFRASLSHMQRHDY